jgi:hypothetical protein
MAESSQKGCGVDLLRKSKIVSAIAAVFVVSSCCSSAWSQTDGYTLSTVKPLAELCLSPPDTFGNCMVYVMAVTDVYFLMYPQCVRPPDIEFRLQVMNKLSAAIANIPADQYETNEAASVVWSTIAGVHPCAASAQSAKPNKKECDKGFALLGDKWINSFQKQAVLEKMRNAGCLNQ